MRLLPRSLLGRAALIIGVLLVASQAVTLYLFRLYTLGPLVEDAAARAASQIGMVVSAMQVLHEEEREEFLDTLETREQIRVLYDSKGMLTTQEPEGAFLRAFAVRLRRAIGADAQFFIQGHNAQALWVKVPVHGDVLWVGIPREQIERPIPWWWIGWAVVCAGLAVVAAYVLLRRVGRPLESLAKASSELATGRQPSPVPVEGPDEVQNVARAFNGMLRDVAQQEEDRAVLLAGISHDLRTPLTRLRLVTELIEGNDEAKIDMARDMEELDAILGQFLDFARTGAGEAFEPVHVDTLVRQCCDLPQSGVDAAHIALNADVTINAQPVALRRAIGNLIGNARKHGAGPVEVRTSVQDNTVSICVLDRGPGIPSGQVDRLLRPFTRLDRSRHGVSGTGLGLAIVDRVARAHSGRLNIEARHEGGLCACLELPLLHA